MGNIPVVTYLIPVLVVVVMIILLIQRRAIVGRTQRMYGHFRLADLAQRLRLNIVEGDPEANMMMMTGYYEAGQKFEPTGGAYARMTGKGTKTVRVRMLGEPYGHPTEFVYHSRTDVDPGVSQTTYTTWFDCRLTIQVPVRFPAFEIVPRAQQKRGFEIRPEKPMPPASFGDPALDATLALTTSEPAVGPVLAPAAAAMAHFTYVHVLGSDGMVSFLLNRTGYTAGMHYLEEAQRVLEQMVGSLAAGPRRAGRG